MFTEIKLTCHRNFEGMLQIVFVFLCCKMFAGREAHVMTFEVGAALEDAKWQAHVYCFDSKKWQRFSMALRA
jgi:hypothetical protein